MKCDEQNVLGLWMSVAKLPCAQHPAAPHITLSILCLVRDSSVMFNLNLLIVGISKLSNPGSRKVANLQILNVKS